MKHSDNLRLAIALIALRHKPAGQTCASYVIELQHMFPLRDVAPATIPRESSEPWRARIEELEKELRELQARHDAQLLESTANRVATRASSNQEATPPCPAPTPVSSKKKSKKKNSLTSAPQEPAHAEGHSQRAPSTTPFKPPLPELFKPRGVLSAFHVLDTLTKARRKEPSAVSIETYALAATRALDSLSATLATLLSPESPTSATSAVMQALGDMLRHLVLAVLPLLSPSRRRDSPTSCARTDAFIGRLSSSVLIPVVSSFYPLSLAHLSAIFSTDMTAESPSRRAEESMYDIRPDAMDLLRTTLGALDELSGDPGSCRLTASMQSAIAALGLAAARELEKLYPPLPATEDLHRLANARARDDSGETARPSPQLPQTRLPPQPSPQKPPPKAKEPPSAHGNVRAETPRGRRVAGLARKDALWYLCHVLHLTAARTSPPAAASAAPGADALLCDGVCTVLAGVLRRVPPGIHMRLEVPRREGDDPDECPVAEGGEGHGGWAPRGAPARALLGGVEREMLLAVAERVWLAQG